MKTHRLGLSVDVISAMVWSVLVITLALLGNQVPRLIRGPILLGFLFIVPGYFLVLALFPRANDIQGLTRAILVVTTSPSLAVLVGLALDKIWLINAQSMSVGLVLISIILAMIAGKMRTRCPDGEGLYPISFVIQKAEILRKNLNCKFSDRRVTTISIALAGLTLLLALGFVVATPAPSQTFTEFYVLGPHGSAEGLLVYAENSSELPQDVTLWIGNHEYKAVTYGVQVQAIRESPKNRRNATVVMTIEEISLDHRERWNITIETGSINSTRYSHVEFLLYKGPTPRIPRPPDEAYRNLRISLPNQ